MAIIINTGFMVRWQKDHEPLGLLCLFGTAQLGSTHVGRYNHLFLFYTVATYFTTAKIIRYKLVCVSKAEFLPPWMKGNLKQNQPSVLSNFLLYAPLSSLHNSELLTPCIKNTVPQKATKFQPCPYVHIRFFSLCFLIFNLVRQDEWSHFLSKKTFEIMEV